MRIGTHVKVEPFRSPQRPAAVRCSALVVGHSLNVHSPLTIVADDLEIVSKDPPKGPKRCQAGLRCATMSTVTLMRPSSQEFERGVHWGCPPPTPRSEERKRRDAGTASLKKTS